MKFTVGNNNNRYICAILSDGKEYDFNKQAVRVDKEDDVWAVYGSTDGTKLIAIIPYINVTMFRARQDNVVVDSGKRDNNISISQTNPNTRVQLYGNEIRS